MRIRGRRLATAAIVVAGLGVAALAGAGRDAGGVRASPTPLAAIGGPGLGSVKFQGDGFAFDHPAGWAFFRFDMGASFFTTIGYLASQPVDVERLCDRSGNGVSCNFGNYDIQPGNVVIRLTAWGIPGGDPIELWDRPAEGRRMDVAGMPAIATQEAAGPNHAIFTWKIASPVALNNWIEIDADVRGPGEGALLAQVNALVESFRYEPAPVPLDPRMADEIAATALASLRAGDPAGFACFPANGGRVEALVQAAPGMPLRQPLPASCSTNINATDLGFWRLDLDITWLEGGEARHYTTVQWLRPDGTASLQGGSGDTLPSCCRE